MPHTCFYKDCVADELIKGGQGQEYGGIFVYYIFIIDRLIFHQMFCGILANTAILLYCIETFCCFCIKLEIQIYIKHPPHKGKCIQHLCTQCYTFTPKFPSAAFDLDPQSKTMPFCLVFCFNPSSMICGLWVRQDLYSIQQPEQTH